MTTRTISIHAFDLPRFIDAFVQFWNDPDVAFPLVENGFADFGVDCLGDDADNAGTTPLEWLHSGQMLFAQFTRRNEGEYELVDGTLLEVPDDDQTEFLDECSTFGFLLRQRGDILTIETAVLNDATGECVVEAVADVGIFDASMMRFLDSMMLPDRNVP